MKSTISLCLLLTVSLVIGPAHASDQPNVVVFLVDDMGVMDTSLPFLTDHEGKAKRYPLNDFYRTPSMERLASQGIRFNQFYAMSVCSPTRVSIMTGQNAARHRTTNWINPDVNNGGKYGAAQWNWAGLKNGDVTLPGILRNNGYRTIHVGKGHFGPENHEGSDPLNLGFSVNVGGASFGAPGSYYAKNKFSRPKRPSFHAVPHLDDYHDSDTFLTEALTIEANKRVADAVASNQPFYLYLSHYAVHAPFEADPRFIDNYDDSEKPANAKAFATLIEGMDKSLGDLVDHLQDLGVAEETLILFLGDNGSDAPLGNQHSVACAAPLRGKKGAHYEGGMRVPFIAAWAQPNPANTMQKKLGIPAGQIQSQVANVTDLFPTILELTSLNAPENHDVDGHRLQTLMTGKSDSSRPEQFLMHYPHGTHRSNYFTTLRDGDWKVIYHALPDVKTSGGFIQFSDGNHELYNLKDDPFEQTNLAKTRPKVLGRMMKKLIASLEGHEALYPVDSDGNEIRPALIK